MTKLIVLPDDNPGVTLADTTDAAEIAAVLARVGVRFEQWAADVPLAADATPDDVLAAYRADVARLTADEGYTTVDVARLQGDPADPTWPTRAAEARGKFLAEHTHA